MHREWFYEYDKFEGGDVLVGDDSPIKIVRWGKLFPILKMEGDGPFQVCCIFQVCLETLYLSIKWVM